MVEVVKLAVHLDPADLVTLEGCDRGKLEACLAAPRAGFGGVEKYVGLPTKAAALLYSLAKGHVLPNGNKRLAYLISTAFLIHNGEWLWVDPDELRQKVEDIAASDPLKHDEVKAELANWMEPHLIPQIEAHVRLQAKLKPGQT